LSLSLSPSLSYGHRIASHRIASHRVAAVLTVRIRKLANEAFQLEVKKQVPAFNQIFKISPVGLWQLLNAENVTRVHVLEVQAEVEVQVETTLKRLR